MNSDKYKLLLQVGRVAPRAPLRELKRKVFVEPRALPVRICVHLCSSVA
jgi:hypothetical protein